MTYWSHHWAYPTENGHSSHGFETPLSEHKLQTASDQTSIAPAMAIAFSTGVKMSTFAPGALIVTISA